MSVIRKVPFIKYLIDDLTAQQKTTLLDVINGEKSLVNASFDNMPNDAITPVLFKLNERDSKTGILILSNNYRVLIAYHRFQDLLMIKLNSDNTYEKINEYLDINELRRLVEEADDHIVASEIDSGEATEGKVLAADGDGGAEWVDTLDTITPETVESGDAVQLFGFDSEGNLVKDDIPEGIVVDETIIEDSPNAVAGGAVYDALEEVGSDITDINNELETKANVDGNYPTMTVGVADQLSPYDESAGDDQDEPFSFQATGTGNGSQPDFSTGSGALMKEKQGNSVVVNQQLNIASSTTGIVLTKTENADGSVTFTNNTGSAVTNPKLFNLNGGNIVSGHKYLFIAKTSIGSGNVLRIWDNSNNINIYPNEVSVSSRNLTNLIDLYLIATVENGASFTLYKYLIDLTQWFNGDIPTDLEQNPDNFFRYYQGSLAYNTGELVNANGRYIKCIGMNQFDEVLENGKAYILANGSYVSDASFISSKNKIKVVPNTKLYFKFPLNVTNLLSYVYMWDAQGNYVVGKNFASILVNNVLTVPSNVSYIAFTLSVSDYGTTYNHDISINLYYEDELRCLTYEPYQVLTNNDTGTETLRSAGSVKDSKEPDGTITRNVGYVKLKDLDWASGKTNVFITNGLQSLIKLGVGVTIKANLSTNLYIRNAWVNVYSSPTTPLSIAVNAEGTVAIYDTNYYDATLFVNHLTNDDILFYELAEPTTEQGTSFSENLVIDDFGSMSWDSDVPQGNLIFYPVDYKAFVDTMYNYTQGTPSNLALKSDLASDKSELQGVDTQLQNALGGTLRQCLCVKESLDFDNTDFVDLGELSWVASSYTGLFYADFTANSNGYGLSTKYKNKGITDYTQMDNKTIQVRQTIIYIQDNTYTDATTFKNAMKNVLLAYEKASE